MPSPGLYTRNTLAMWSDLAPWAQVRPGSTPGWSVVTIPAQPASRVIAHWPPPADAAPIAALLAGHRGPGRFVVEDSDGSLALPSGDHITVDRFPVMVRPAGPALLPAPAAGVQVELVTDPATLAQAERVIVDGFPQRSLQPYRPGRSVPALALAVPRLRVWLARDGGEPAGACCSYDDGTALGIYWLATLPQHRSRGIGRAVMAVALAAAPGRPAVLVATPAGQPLYTSLSFRIVATAAWYRAHGPGGQQPPAGAVPPDPGPR